MTHWPLAIRLSSHHDVLWWIGFCGGAFDSLLLLTHWTAQLIRYSYCAIVDCISHLLTHISAPPHRFSGFLLYVLGESGWTSLLLSPGPMWSGVYSTWRCGGVYVLIVYRGGISGPGDSIGSSASVTVGVNEAVYWAGMWAKVTDTCLINMRLFVNVDILLLFYYFILTVIFIFIIVYNQLINVWCK